ncbi:MAG: hemolysin III family protein [Pseudomonadota bacterium]
MAYLTSFPERLADGIIHAAGFSAALAAGIVLIVQAALWHSGADVAAISIYIAALLIGFVASAAYNLTPWLSARPWLHRLDHAAIYLKIAGTYTPLVVLMDTALAYTVLAIVWVVAILGAIGKLTGVLRPGLGSTLLYIALGWASVVLIWPLAHTLPLPALILMIAGGVLYTIGVLFNHAKDLRFSAAIWHGFVVSASTCFFIAIAMGLGAQA